LCERCKQAYVPDAAELDRIGFAWDREAGPPTLYRAAGCSACSQTGFRGRMALHEVMSVSEDISRLAVGRASTDEIARVAREQGMTTLKNDGWRKVLQGRTSIEEILRVVA
jgi:type IV pilus assembly protein PilB